MESEQQCSIWLSLLFFCVFFHLCLLTARGKRMKVFTERFLLGMTIDSLVFFSQLLITVKRLLQYQSITLGDKLVKHKHCQ